MSVPPSRSFKAGRRGRHRYQGSPETRAWEALAGTAWLAADWQAPVVDPLRDTYERLLRLRSQLADGSGAA